MARILALDYGGKRTGIAVTDPLQIIATALTTVETATLWPFLTTYLQQEDVEKVLIGWPTHADGQDTHATPLVRAFQVEWEKRYPNVPLIPVDERYTSKLAVRAMIDGGMKKKDRQNKGNIDKMSAVILLQDYLMNASSGTSRRPF